MCVCVSTLGTRGHWCQNFCSGVQLEVHGLWVCLQVTFQGDETDRCWCCLAFLFSFKGCLSLNNFKKTAVKLSMNQRWMFGIQFCIWFMFTTCSFILLLTVEPGLLSAPDLRSIMKLLSSVQQLICQCLHIFESCVLTFYFSKLTF